MRKRKVITRSGARTRGCYFSLKSSRLIEWDSPLENDALHVMEFDDRIAFLRGHQEEIRVDGLFIAFPDLFTELVDGTIEIVEVKDDFALTKPEVLQRLAQIAAHYERAGVRYRVMAEQEIRQQPRLRNLASLTTFRRPGMRARLLNDPQIRELLQLSHSTTLGYVSLTLGSPARARQLLANRLLLADFTLPLGPETRVSVMPGVLP
jgi:hypothetical protein